MRSCSTVWLLSVSSSDSIPLEVSVNLAIALDTLAVLINFFKPLCFSFYFLFIFFAKCICSASPSLKSSSSSPLCHCLSLLGIVLEFKPSHSDLVLHSMSWGNNIVACNAYVFSCVSINELRLLFRTFFQVKHNSCEDHEDWFPVHFLALDGSYFIFFFRYGIGPRVGCGCYSFVAVCNGRILIVGRRSLLRLSWRGLNFSCSVVCNQGGAAKAAEIFVVVADSIKAAAFYMHVGFACCAPIPWSRRWFLHMILCVWSDIFFRGNGIVRLSRELVNNIRKKICKEFITKEREVDAISADHLRS